MYDVKTLLSAPDPLRPTERFAVLELNPRILFSLETLFNDFKAA